MIRDKAGLYAQLETRCEIAVAQAMKRQLYACAYTEDIAHLLKLDTTGLTGGVQCMLPLPPNSNWAIGHVWRMRRAEARFFVRGESDADLVEVAAALDGGRL